MKINNNILLLTIVAVFLIGGSFFAGLKYQQSKTQKLTNAQGTRGGQFGQRGQGQNFRPVMGEIISQDDKSITVKLQDGSSKIIILGQNTTVSKSQDASKSDAKVGDKVIVFGMENPDGSVSAQNIQLNPPARRPISSPGN